MPKNPHEPPKLENIPGADMPFNLNWRRVAVGLGIFALLTLIYCICWMLGLATEPAKF